MSQKYEKLKTLLKELFQLDQPDLDFGLYRIMHAKAGEVTQFLEKDLLPQVREAFSLYKTADKAELEKELATAIEQAQGLGVDPETTQKVKDLRAKLANDAVDIGALEQEVYDHLYSFFRRYYSEGDFLAKRVYKPGVYAIPYEGEEVKLHWANKDQYYIKTSEYLREYSFQCSMFSVQEEGQLKTESLKTEHSRRVHFRLVEATEGEHGNVKEAAGKDRRFKLAPAPFAAVEGGELVIRFTYEPDPAKQKELNTAAEAAILGLNDATLADWLKAMGAKHIRSDGTVSDATRLRVHLDRYTARNTFDYFIHKDLGCFLRRELDFYIKNEVMHLDDVESETTARVEQYLSKIKVIRRIAGKIIAFLAQLEDFQKKLWLKKKFVVQTDYCITLGCIPKEFYPEIAANDAQRQDWIRLFAIDEIKGEATKMGYSVPLTVEFLKHNRNLILDTQFWPQDFKDRLIAALPAIDDSVSGVLVCGDNRHALDLLRCRFRKQVKCIYIDPPYNTGEDDFPYKDSYQHSSWMCMMKERAELARSFMANDALFAAQIGDDEAARLRLVLDDVFAERKNSAVVRRGIKNVQAQFTDIDRLTLGHDIVHVYTAGTGIRLPHLRQALEADKPGKWDTFWRGTDRETMRYELFGENPTTGQWRWEEGRAKRAVRNYERYLEMEASHKALDEWYAENLQAGVDLDFVRLNEDQVVQYYVPPQGFRLVSDNWLDIPAAGNLTEFPHEKSLYLLQRIIGWCTTPGDWVLDYFAGSGSTGHAAFAMQPVNQGKRRYILAEMALYFDSTLMPRIKQYAYCVAYRDGKPLNRDSGTSQTLKYMRLESYEDVLNNLETRRSKVQQSLLESSDTHGTDGLKEQYLLRYMLDVETRGSQSLLNIQAFKDPTAYKLKVKRSGSDETREVNVDLLETFNWLIGLTVHHIAAPQKFTAAFERDSEKRLRLRGRLKPVVSVQSSVVSVQKEKTRESSLKTEPLNTENCFWFRTVTGTTPDGRKTLVIWRKLTGNLEEDNLVLDEWFTKQGYSTKDYEFQLIYVNGDNNLENLKAPDDTWKVRLIEEDFHRLMFDTEGV
ncbi:MAG: site-specific DNA-methyltransferase [Nitrospira sp.]|nr:site-specific DNA-methyltransferase [Nitrospira sp.]